MAPSGNVLNAVAEDLNLTGLTADQLQAIFLLHELGHVLTDPADASYAGTNPLPSDSNNNDQSRKNSLTVIENCFPSLMGH